MTSSAEVVKRVSNECPGGHRHVHLEQGRTKMAQVYPRASCHAVCDGIASQRRMDSLGVVAMPVMNLDQMTAVANERGRKDESPEEFLHEECGYEAFDDVTGDEVDPKLMRIARKEEIEYFQKWGYM